MRVAPGLVALLLLAGGGAPADEPPLRCGMDAEAVYARAQNGVVEVYSLAIDQFRVADRVLPSYGSGFILEDGMIVTSYHVIADAHEVVVRTNRGVIDVRIRATDPVLDLAILLPGNWTFDRAAAGDPRGLGFADPASLAMGEPVFSIGFPLGLGKTVTQGIITGMGRVRLDTTTSWMSPMLQTNAAINPGNSGGPLLDDCGRVVGLIARRLSPDYAEATGFAIPADILKPAVDELRANGRISRPWHGLYGQMTTPPILMMLGVPYEDWKSDTGFLVETVEPGSAADSLGLLGGVWPVSWGGSQILLGGDIITEVNGRRIGDRTTAMDVVRGLKVGEKVSVTYIRDGSRFEGSVTLTERPLLPADLARYRTPGVSGP